MRGLQNENSRLTRYHKTKLHEDSSAHCNVLYMKGSHYTPGFKYIHEDPHFMKGKLFHKVIKMLIASANFQDVKNSIQIFFYKKVYLQHIFKDL
jgi:hypothetical protein